MKNEVKMIQIDGNQLDKQAAEEAHALGYDTRYAFIIPIKYEEKFRAIINTLSAFLEHSTKELNISEDLWIELKKLIAAIVYLSNSTSFLKGDKYYDFDKFEIDKKLERKLK